MPSNSTRQKGAKMKEQTGATSTEKRPRFPITEVLLTATTVLAAVVAVAMTDPKIPPAVGD